MYNGSFQDKVKPSLVAYIVIVCVALLLWLIPFNATFLLSEAGNLRFMTLMESLVEVPTLVTYWVNFAIILLIGFTLGLINSAFSLLKAPTILPTVLCIFVMIISLEKDAINYCYFLTLIELAIIASAFALSESFHELHSFNIGGLITIGSVVYTPFSLNVIPVLAFLYFSNRIQLKTVLSIIIGGLTIAIYAVAGIYQLGYFDGISWTATPSFSLNDFSEFEKFGRFSKIFYTYLLAFIFVCVMRLSSHFSNKSIQQRGKYSLLVVIIALATFFAVTMNFGFESMLSTIITLGTFCIGGAVTLFYRRELIITWMYHLFVLMSVGYLVVKLIGLE
ncbi:MAG: hypothetical protein KBT22_07880 [Bacteroidales bacterium]|nr:hypothetical protein [Candidatus Scybalocola fimicaballi]